MVLYIDIEICRVTVSVLITDHYINPLARIDRISFICIRVCLLNLIVIHEPPIRELTLILCGYSHFQFSSSIQRNRYTNRIFIRVISFRISIKPVVYIDIESDTPFGSILVSDNEFISLVFCNRTGGQSIRVVPFDFFPAHIPGIGEITGIICSNDYLEILRFIVLDRILLVSGILFFTFRISVQIVFHIYIEVNRDLVSILILHPEFIVP